MKRIFCVLTLIGALATWSPAQGRQDEREDKAEHKSARAAHREHHGKGEAREDITRGELKTFDQFLDQHAEIAAALEKNPSLVNNRDFLEDHPALRDFLKTHPELREELTENPRAFMRRENQFDQGGQRNEDITRGELKTFDQFLDKHPEITGALERNPSLVNNRDFLEDHPALRDFLEDHPEVREELRENPGLFMQRERSFEKHEQPQK